MKKKMYKVKASYITYLDHIIFAKDEDEAWKIAKNLDGGEFNQIYQDDWNIDDVAEIKE